MQGQEKMPAAVAASIAAPSLPCRCLYPRLYPIQHSPITNHHLFLYRRLLPLPQITNPATIKHQHSAKGHTGCAAGQAAGQAHGADKKREYPVDAMGKPDSHAVPLLVERRSSAKVEKRPGRDIGYKNIQ